VTELIVPLILCGVGVFALFRRTDLYPALIRGAGEGLSTAKRILPPVVVLLSAVYLFRASGAMDVLVRLLAPLTNLFGIPPECAPLMLIRPLSGSAALAAGADIIATYGADSLIGRTAAVMLGSSETTFYVISVYFGSLGIKKTRGVIPAALFSDFIGALAAAFFTRLFWG